MPPVCDRASRFHCTTLTNQKKEEQQPYFDGHLSDGTTTLRFIGFDEEFHSVLKSQHSSEDLVILTKCNLAKAKRDTDRSPVAYINKGKTTIDKSPKKFEIPSPNLLSNNKILLEQLALLRLHIVLKVHHPITVGYDNKIMQKVLIADNTGNTTIQLWGYEISTIKINKTYKFTNFAVKEFSEEKYLSFTPFSTHKEVSSIGKVVKPNESKCNEAGEVVEVIAVNSLISTYRCIARGCNSKVKKY